MTWCPLRAAMHTYMSPVWIAPWITPQSAPTVELPFSAMNAERGESVWTLSALIVKVQLGHSWTPLLVAPSAARVSPLRVLLSLNLGQYAART